MASGGREPPGGADHRLLWPVSRPCHNRGLTATVARHPARPATAELADAISPRAGPRRRLEGAGEVPRRPRLAVRAVPPRRGGGGVPPGDGLRLSDRARRDAGAA